MIVSNPTNAATCRMSRQQKRLSEEALYGALIANAKWQASARIIDDERWLIVAGGSSYPVPNRNFAIRWRKDVSAWKFLERARKVFFSINRGFSVLCRHEETDLREALSCYSASFLGSGYRMTRATSGSVKNTAPLITRSIESSKDIEDIVFVCEQAFDYPKNEIRVSFSDHVQILNSSIRGRIVYHGEEAAASGIAITNGSVATLDWIATVPNFQGKGFASACIVDLIVDCFYAGVGDVFLTSTPAAVGVYQAHGFENFGGFDFFLASPDS